jgi:hypothetical protein
MNGNQSCPASALPPRRVPGRAEPTMSPLTMAARLRHVRGDIDPEEDSDVWLTEQPIRTIGKRGIEFGGDHYSSPELASYVTGPSDTPRPNFVIRYDRSRYARGTLDMVKVFIVDDQRRYEFVAACGLVDQLAQNTDGGEFVRRRARYQRLLRAQRQAAEEAYLDTALGPEAVERLRQDQEARVATGSNRHAEPIVSTPIRATPAHQPDESLGQKLAAVQPPPAPTIADRPVPPPPAPAPAAAPTESRGLGERLANARKQRPDSDES